MSLIAQKGGHTSDGSRSRVAVLAVLYYSMVMYVAVDVADIVSMAVTAVNHIATDVM